MLSRDSFASSVSVDTSNSSEIPTSRQVRPSRLAGDASMNPYEKILYDLGHDSKCIKELRQGTRIGFYRLAREIGKGNFSQVRLGNHVLTKDKVAIKILDKTKLDAKTQHLLSREISSMERLRHPNIIRLYEVIETIPNLYLIMEYARGGDLFTKLTDEGRLQESEARPLFAQIVSAVDHMHINNIFHRDLKAENIFFANYCFIKVGDFGFSTHCREDVMLNTYCGSPPYAAPELFHDDQYYGTFVDIWALGILLYFMVTGVLPFRADTIRKLKKCIMEGTYTVPPYISESCNFLIHNILKRNPADRLSIDDIKESEWVEGEEFIDNSESFKLISNEEQEENQQTERETRKLLHDFGVSSDMLENDADKVSRSNINGMYHIIQHTIQKRRSEIESNTEADPGTHRSRQNHYSVSNNVQKKESKMCVLI